MNNLTTNIAQAYEHNYDLTVKEVGKTLKTGMRKALQVLVKDTKANLRASVRNVSKKNPKYSDTLLSGVRSSRVYLAKNGGVIGFGKISRRRKADSGAFRLVFLEQGTQTRRLRKNGANRGQITGKWFFKKAVDSGSNKFEANMIKAIQEAISKINASK